jgi:hypothetical protein
MAKVGGVSIHFKHFKAAATVRVMHGHWCRNLPCLQNDLLVDLHTFLTQLLPLYIARFSYFLLKIVEKRPVISAFVMLFI